MKLEPNNAGESWPKHQKSLCITNAAHDMACHNEKKLIKHDATPAARHALTMCGFALFAFWRIYVNVVAVANRKNLIRNLISMHTGTTHHVRFCLLCGGCAGGEIIREYFSRI